MAWLTSRFVSTAQSAHVGSRLVCFKGLFIYLRARERESKQAHKQGGVQGENLQQTPAEHGT